MASPEKSGLETWRKRWHSAETNKKRWHKRCRVKECYNYWNFNQLVNAFDEHGVRKVQINKIHPEVRAQIPSLYYYRPFARITPQPELADTPGSEIDGQSQILQDTANHLIRIKHTRFRENTFHPLTESFWAMGIAECGYSADPVDDPGGDRPALKEKKETKIPGPVKEKPPETEEEALDRQISELQGKVKHEKFYVKHIPEKQFMVSDSDRPITEENDWVGYWEDCPLQDIKAAGKRGVYQNTEKLKAVGADAEKDDRAQIERYHTDEERGLAERVRIYKVWDLRTMTKLVWAEQHDQFLLREKFDRLPLKTLRFDIDPYHFYPIPPIMAKLAPQDEYNHSRDWLRKLRNGIIPRYTYDEDAVDAEQMQKLEKGILGTYVPRHSGTNDPIQPINQPSFSENAIQTLTLSDKEFKDVGGVGGDPKVAASKTATQAKIAEVKEQVQDSADRQIVAVWLGEIVEELLMLAIDHMLIEKWVGINIAPDSQYAEQLGQEMQQQHRMITGDKLRKAATGLEYDVIVDMESLSPVTEEEKFQKLMQGMMFISNPQMQQVFAVAPDLLEELLKSMGIRNARKIEMITGAMEKLMEIQMAQAQAGQQPGPGQSPPPSGGMPGQPSPDAQVDTPGGPQPGGPAGPGASVPS